MFLKNVANRRKQRNQATSALLEDFATFEPFNSLGNTPCQIYSPEAVDTGKHVSLHKLNASDICLWKQIDITNEICSGHTFLREAYYCTKVLIKNGFPEPLHRVWNNNSWIHIYHLM